MSAAEHNRSVPRSQHDQPATVCKARVGRNASDGRDEARNAQYEWRHSRQYADDEDEEDGDGRRVLVSDVPSRSRHVRATARHTSDREVDEARYDEREPAYAHARVRRNEARQSDVEVVEIVKRPGQTLGFYIREGNGVDRRDGVFVSRIAYNSALGDDNFLQVGDEIVSVNGVMVRNVSLDDVVILMSVPQKLVFEIKRRRPPANRRAMELRRAGAGGDFPLGDDSNDSGLSSENSLRSADQRVRFNERRAAAQNGREFAVDLRHAAASEYESSRSRRLRPATNGANHKDYCSDTEAAFTESHSPHIAFARRRDNTASIARRPDERDYRVGRRSLYDNGELESTYNRNLPLEYATSHSEGRYGSSSITPMQARLLTCDTGGILAGQLGAVVKGGSPGASPLARAQQQQQLQQLQQQAYDSLLNVQQRVQEQAQIAALGRRVPLLRQHTVDVMLPGTLASGGLPGSLQAIQAGLQGGLQTGLQGGLQGSLQASLQAGLQGGLAAQGIVPGALGQAVGYPTLPDGQAGLLSAGLGALAGPALLAAVPAVGLAGGRPAQPLLAMQSGAQSSVAPTVGPARGVATRKAAPLRTRQIELARSQLRLNFDEFSARPSDRISRWGAGRPAGDGLEGQMQVHVYCGRGLQAAAVSGQAPLIKDLYCVLELDSTRRTRTVIRTGVDEFEWDEWFELDLEGARVLTLLVYSWDPDTAQHQHTLHFYGNVSLMHFFQEQRAALAAGAAHTHKVALRLEPKGVLYLDLCYRTLFVSLRRQLAALTVVSNAESGAAYLVNGAQVFGVPIDSLVRREQQQRLLGTLPEARDAATNHIPGIVKRCVEEVELRGLDIVGLYRQTGSGRAKQRLREQFERFDASLVDLSVEAVSDVHVITSLLKDYLRELPEPLFTVALYRPLLDAMRNMEVHADDGNSFPAMKMQSNSKLLLSLLDTIPVINQATIMCLIDHLKRVSKRCDTNKMTRANLAVCFGPLLLCPSLSVSVNEHCVFEIKKQIDCFKWLLDYWPDMSASTLSLSTNFTNFAGSNAFLQFSANNVKEDPLYQHPLATGNDGTMSVKTSASSTAIGRPRGLLSGSQRSLSRHRLEQASMMGNEVSHLVTPQKHDYRRRHHHNMRSRSTERPT